MMSVVGQGCGGTHRCVVWHSTVLRVVQCMLWGAEAHGAGAC